LVNGRTDYTTNPNTSVVLTWQVRNATNVRIRRTSAAGPAVYDENPAGNSMDLGPFVEFYPVDATYELAVGNQCGNDSRTVSVHLRKVPDIKIVGVELIQAIQRFDLNRPMRNNSVILRGRKRTIARLYIDSGITDGFDNSGGSGPNTQGNVTGSVVVYSDNARNGIDSGPPLNAVGSVVARPRLEINRSDLTQTLNFELPWGALVKDVRIVATVWVDGHQNDIGTGWFDRNDSTNVRFIRGGINKIYHIRIRDDSGHLPPANVLNPPSMFDIYRSLIGAHYRMPVTEDGFQVYLLPGVRVIGSRKDLTTKRGWEDLLNDLEDIADTFDINGGILTAMVPNDDEYALNGIATSGQRPFPHLFNEHPRMMAKATLPATFAHELGHIFGLHHARCPVEEMKDCDQGEIDRRLPLFE
jgi:hypothetical protein